MPHSPRISLVVATYNHARYLPEALDSFLAQDLAPDLFEVIVVDDGSTDDTSDVLLRYASRIVVINQLHQGLVQACNAGLARARGEYFVRADSDDFVGPTLLKREMELLDLHPEACGIYPDYVPVIEDGGQLSGEPQLGSQLYGMAACGVMSRTQMIRAVGGYRVMYWEEYDLYLRLSERGPFFHLGEPLYYYRRHASNMTQNVLRRKQGWQELLSTWGKERLLAAGSHHELEDVISESTPANRTTS